MTDTIRELLSDIAVRCCTEVCKYYQGYLDGKDLFDDTEEAYERLCIEHCENCPLNELGVWI